jgi:N-acetylmuramoyl-L-alanine amidase
MFHRFAVMVAAAAFAASSVAPAQVPMGLAQLPAIQANDVSPSVIAPGEPLLSIDTRTPGAAPAEDVADTVAPAAVAPTVAVASGSSQRELDCLAAGVYFESKSEPLAGQMAVAHVIANRAKSRGRFPPSYCGVLFQRGQFSFVRAGGWPPVAKNGAQWKSAMNVARLIDSAARPSNIGKALFFHAKRVSPGWKLTRVASIGNHVFYR